MSCMNQRANFNLNGSLLGGGPVQGVSKIV